MAATLLAAGRGRRLGDVPKPALRIHGESLFERLVRALRQSGIGPISAVIGPYAPILLPLARRCDVQVVAQPEPAAALAASQRLAVQHHRQCQPGLDMLLLVADLPLLAADDLAPVLRAWASRPAGIEAQVPVVRGVRGHPVLLSWSAVQAVASQPEPLGVRDWLQTAAGVTHMLETDRAALVTDLDTPEDLRALRARLPEGAIDDPPAR